MKSIVKLCYWSAGYEKTQCYSCGRNYWEYADAVKLEKERIKTTLVVNDDRCKVFCTKSCLYKELNNLIRETHSFVPCCECKRYVWSVKDDVYPTCTKCESKDLSHVA